MTLASTTPDVIARREEQVLPIGGDGGSAGQTVKAMLRQIDRLAP
jgi:hypothetical protein